MTIQLY